MSGSGGESIACRPGAMNNIKALTRCNPTASSSSFLYPNNSTSKPPKKIKTPKPRNPAPMIMPNVDDVMLNSVAQAGPLAARVANPTPAATSVKKLAHINFERFDCIVFSTE